MGWGCREGETQRHSEAWQQEVESRGTEKAGRGHQVERCTAPSCSAARYRQGSGGGWGRPGSHQGLIGREEGGPTVIPSDGQQRHGAKLLTGEVRGGTAS